MPEKAWSYKWSMTRGGAVRSDPLRRRELPATTRDSVVWASEYSLAVLVSDTLAPSAASHTQHSDADKGLLSTVQPVTSGLTAAAGHVTVRTGTMLLNAVFLVASLTADLGNTGSIPTQGITLLKDKLQWKNLCFR